MAPSTRQIFATSFVILQVVNLISTQAQVEQFDNNNLMRETRALNLSEKDYAECPHCNVMSEVSSVNQQIFTVI